MESDPIKKLTEYFRGLPGIGPRQARRFAYYMLGRNNSFVNDFIMTLKEAKEKTRQCGSCRRFYAPGAQTSRGECSLCTQPERDTTLLLVVEKDIDVDAMEKSDAYKGKYFVLGGLFPILEKEPSRFMRDKELARFIQKSKDLKEIIIALAATAEGDHTASYLKTVLVPSAEKPGIKISILGRGLSTGAELEYSDADTLTQALKNRA